jgi:hypothetical protein
MTSVKPPDIDSTRQSKSTWGPGKNAALSVVAFAAIFGTFAYVRRDAGDGRANAVHRVSGVVETTVVVPDDSTAATAAKPPTVNTVLAAPPPETASPATRRINAHSVATHPRSLHDASVAMAANASADGSVKRGYGDAHRHRRIHDPASARTRIEVASRSPSFSGGSGSGRLQTTSVTREELEGARALAKARSCAQINEWSCVEQNASRALALDPENSESRALLGQAIRNGL